MTRKKAALASQTYLFKSQIELLGANPFVFVPEDILQGIFKKAGKGKGKIPIAGAVNGKPFKQTLIKYSGAWRLYINTTMLKNSPKHIGDTIEIMVWFDPESRAIKPPDGFVNALAKNKKAQTVFDSLPPSGKFEIVRYLARLKTKEALDRNIKRAILFLCGKGRFVGKEKPQVGKSMLSPETPA